MHIQVTTTLTPTAALADSHSFVLQESGERHELCKEIRANKESLIGICAKTQKFNGKGSEGNTKTRDCRLRSKHVQMHDPRVFGWGIHGLCCRMRYCYSGRRNFTCYDCKRVSIKAKMRSTV